MKKTLLFLLLFIPFFAIAQNPVIVSQPYKFQKFVRVAGSLFSDSTILNTDSSKRVATTEWAKRNFKAFDPSAYVRKDYIFTTTHTVQLGDTTNFLSWLKLDPVGGQSIINSQDLSGNGGELALGTSSAIFQLNYNGNQQALDLNPVGPISVINSNKYGASYDQHPNYDKVTYSGWQLTDQLYVDSAIAAHTTSLPYWALTGSSNLTGTTNILTGSNTLNIGSGHGLISISVNDTTTANIHTTVGDSFTGRSTTISQTKDVIGMARYTRFGTGFKYQGFFAGSKGDVTTNFYGFKDDFNRKPPQQFGQVPYANIGDSSYVYKKAVVTIADSVVTAHGGGGNAIYNENVSGTRNGTNLTFTLAHTPITGKLNFFLNGLLQDPGDDYTITANTITMALPPISTDKLRASYIY